MLVRGADRRDSQLRCLDVLGRAFDGATVLSSKLGDELQQRGALIIDRLAIAVEQRLVLSCQDIDPGLQLRETISDVVHQQPVTRLQKKTLEEEEQMLNFIISYCVSRTHSERLSLL